ncbi:MAG: hypothetical protein ACLQVN_21970 [Bryobacteraceae bacterium]
MRCLVIAAPKFARNSPSAVLILAGWAEAIELGRLGKLSTRFHMPIVAMTAHAMSGDPERCSTCGKPLRKHDLLDAIERARTLAPGYPL